MSLVCGDSWYLSGLRSSVVFSPSLSTTCVFICSCTFLCPTICLSVRTDKQIHYGSRTGLWTSSTPAKPRNRKTLKQMVRQLSRQDAYRIRKIDEVLVRWSWIWILVFVSVGYKKTKTYRGPCIFSARLVLQRSVLQKSDHERVRRRSSLVWWTVECAAILFSLFSPLLEAVERQLFMKNSFQPLYNILCGCGSRSPLVANSYKIS